MKLSVGLRLFILFLILSLSDCTTPPKSQLTRGEKVWKEADINNYQISVQVVQSIWHLQVYNLTIENGLVIEFKRKLYPRAI